MNPNFEVMKKDEIETRFNFNTNNFLDYLQVQLAWKKFLKENKLLLNKTEFFQKPYIPHHFSILHQLQNGSRGIYNMINTNRIEGKYKLKWNVDLNLNIDDLTWKNVFKQIFQSGYDNTLIWFQYRLIHRILGTNVLLSKTMISTSATCRLCNSELESLMHLFVECNSVTGLWRSVETWINIRLNKSIRFSKNTIILGYLNKDNYYIPLNMIIAVTKKYIFKCVVQNYTPNINQLKNKLKREYDDQTNVNQNKNKEIHFFNAWGPFNNLFS